ncbi:hypothetical protein D3C73_1512680 [compost metagenome]
MAAKADADVHLEAMEEAENEGAESTKVGSAEVASLPMGKLPFGLLAHSWKPGSVSLHNKRKARTGRVF